MSAAADPSTPLRLITKDPKIHDAPERKKRSRVAFEADEADELFPNAQRKLKLKKEQPLQHPDFVAVFVNLAING